MRLSTYAYVPGSNFGHPRIFVENLRRHPAKHPLVTFSHAWDEADVKIKNPEILKGATDKNGRLIPWAISSVIWWTAVRIAASQGADYMLFLEPDCRVGRAGWDDAAFTEFFLRQEEDSNKYVMGGSVVFYAPFNHSGDYARRFFHWYTHQKMAIPCPVYGGAGPQLQRTLMYPNGALGVYDVRWLTENFNLENSVGLATEEAWDILVALKAWEIYGPNVFNAVCHLNSIYSGCGDKLNTEGERMSWLRSGRFAAVHQVKTEATA